MTPEQLAAEIAERNVAYWYYRWNEYVSRKKYSDRHANVLEYMLRNAKDYQRQVAGQKEE